MSKQNTVIDAFRLLERFAPPAAAEAAYALWLSTGKRKRVHPREQAVIDQATVSSIRVNGTRIAVYTWGNGAKPVLLVHGWQGRAAEFAEVVREVRATDRTVIAFDAPGHGASGGRRPDIRDFAEVIGALGRKHGTFEAIIAHSFGTPAAALAIRGGTRTRRLVSIGGVAEMAYLLDSFSQMLNLSPRTSDSLKRKIQQRRFRAVPDVWATLSATTTPLAAEVPMLVIHDHDDLVVQVGQAEALADAHLLSATTMFTSGLGHHRILRDDAVLDAIGEFVGSPLPVTVAR
ncbi:MAG TPA: alpha/beta hydrolase [Homoserinimonas sp.]|nr:alpha/beta hydrolase [Homoserinimonas sp.]